jgi:hypothetical protein
MGKFETVAEPDSQKTPGRNEKLQETFKAFGEDDFRLPELKISTRTHLCPSGERSTCHANAALHRRE